MSKNLEEHGLVSTVNQRTNHKDFQNCLFACFLSQMEPMKIDVKSAFLYEKIEKEVYVCQPPGFKDPDFLDKVYKVEKALYGLRQAPRAWKEMCTEFKKMMHKKFQMSSMGDLTFFLGLQVRKKEDGIFISQDKHSLTTAKLKVNAARHKFIAVGFNLMLLRIIDFLNANPIKYALTVNPTIYTSCIEQFWATATVKNINEKVRIHAKVDGKKVIISKETIRRDLKFEDKGGVDCLSNEVIFEQLPLMGYENLSQKLTFYKAFFSQQQKFLIHTILQWLNMGEGLTTPSAPQNTPPIIQPTISKPQKKQKPMKPKRQDTELPQTSAPTETVADEAVNEEMYDSLERATTTVTSFDAEQDRVNIKSSTEEESLGEEDASKQGRNIADIDTDAEITLVDETAKDQRRFNDQEMFDIDVLNDEEVVVKDVNAASIAIVVTATATTVVSIDDITLAQALVNIKTSKPMARGVIIKDPSGTPTTTTIPISLKVQDKGKGILVKEPLKMKKKDQISFDEQEARRLQAEFDEQVRLAEEKAQLIEDENLAWDNVQAMMVADYELAVRLHKEEQGELTVEEKSRLFVELMDKRKKHFEKLRAEEKRRKPPTKAQKRNQMCIYLKNIVGFTHSQIKNKRFDEVQKAFDRTMSWINSFVPMDSEVMKEKAKLTQENSSKRAGDKLDQERSKKQKVEDDKEPEELKRCLKINSDDGDDVTIDTTHLSIKTPIIDYKIYKERKKSYF
nr:retrotransposon protein, putative, unclassified [Tanacetum cinerariifolium]